MDVRGQRAADRADHEDERQEQDALTPAAPVGEPAADDGAEGRPDGEDAADESLLEFVDAQATGDARHVHVGKGSRDDAGIVAEEEGAEGRDGRQELDGTRGSRGRGGFHQFA